MKKIQIKTWVYVALIIIFSGLIIYSLIHIIGWRLNTNDNKKIKKETNSLIKVDENKKDEKEKYAVNFDELKKKNKDTVAYLKVNGTDIDYVVVKGQDNSYYLTHNFNKKYNVAGWIFADYKNKFDGSDKNIVIYGHNMQDGSMFGTLKKALTSNWQNNQENLQIVLIMERKEYLYQVFSTYVSEPEEYYIQTDFSTNQSYEQFLKTIKSRSNHDYGVDLNPNDRVLTLSTCNLTGTKRIVLHAKKVN